MPPHEGTPNTPDPGSSGVDTDQLEPRGTAVAEGPPGSDASRGSRVPSAAPSAATMMDVAREAGVSQSTVSRVLSGSPSQVPIAQSTRDRVVSVARDLGYRPNPLARGLRGSGTMLLGVIVRDISDPFFIGAIEAISRQAERRGYNVVLGTAHSRADEAIVLRGVLETRHCDAIVLLGDMGDQPRLIHDLQDARVPVVALWQGLASPGICNINVDNRSGIEAVMDHLLGLGHERIAFISGRPLGDIQERQAAFLERIGRAGIVLPKEYVRGVSNDPSGGAEALRALLAMGRPPTAVICSTDMIAMGVLHEAARSGVRVPGRLSVTGFDDLPFSRFLVPSLTTVAMPTAAMTARAVDVALNAMTQGTRSRADLYVMTPELVVRDSTAAP